MIRVSFGRAALAATFVWLASFVAHAQTPKSTDPKSAGDSKSTDPKPSNLSPQTQKINELILKGYESAGIKRPAVRAKDDVLRRVFIDLIGRIATPEEVIDFEKDSSPDKRLKLVLRLMSASDYQPRGKNGQFIVEGKEAGKPKHLKFDYNAQFAEHWAEIWTVWLMTRTGHQDYREQMRVWLEDQFVKNVSHKDSVVKLLTATGQVGGAKPAGEGWTPKDSYAANFIIHHLGEPVPAAQRNQEGAFDAVPITSRVTRLFLGLQTQCTQCHDHPFNKEWVQTDFWGVNAFFRQTVRSATPSGAPVGNNPKMANAALVTLTDDPGLNAEKLVFYERRDGRRLGSFPVMLKDYAQAMNGEKSSKTLAAAADGKTRRQHLAEWVVTHDNFAKAYVNRIWADFFGRGLNKEPSADDFGSNNEIVHPELLNYLAEEFAKYNYDPKRLMEWICTSDVYQLSHVAPKEYLDPKAEPTKLDPLFLRMPLKAMSPEVLFESLKTATRADRRKTATKDQRDAWMRKLVRQFGDDEGNELSFNGTIVQALLMMNGAELNGELGIGRNAEKITVIDELLRKPGVGGSPKAMYDELFLLTLNRHPTQAEITKLEDVRGGKAAINVGPAPKGPAKGPAPKGPRGGSMVYAPGAGPGDKGFYQDVFWALLNTNEFMLNH